MVRQSIRPIALATGLALLAGAALGHHGFTGRYDISQPIWIEGEVRDAYFGQPHATVTVRTAADLSSPGDALDLAGAGNVIRANALVVRDELRGTNVTVEFPPTRHFSALGSQIALGDRVAVIAFRNCEPPHQLRGQWIRPEGGMPVARSGRVQYQVDGCE